MPRKRDGFVPLGDVAEAVELPDGRALTHRSAADRYCGVGAPSSAVWLNDQTYCSMPPPRAQTPDQRNKTVGFLPSGAIWGEDSVLQTPR